MIDNPNPRNFYSEKEMNDRQAYISKAKENLLKKLKDLTSKIESEEPFPHGNIDLDTLVQFDDEVDKMLNCWYY